MPRQARKVPRPCPRCGKHMIRQPYYGACTWCKRKEKRLKREQKQLVKTLMQALS